MEDNNINLEEYYRDPIIESWTYVSIGMDNLKNYDSGMYENIMKKQVLLLPERKERLKDIKQTSDALGLDYAVVEAYINEFLQKFPLSLRQDVAWDDPDFIFLYILTKMLKPNVIIETGSNIGFSSTFIALAVKENANGCRFYTMDPGNFAWNCESFITENTVRKQKINYSKLTGKCEALSMVPSDLREYIIFNKASSREVLPALLEDHGKIDIFFHDSEHSYRNTLWECLTALPYIRKEGYILVHDITENSVFNRLFSKENSTVAVRNGEKNNLGIARKINNDYISMEKEFSTPEENALLNNEEYELKKNKLDSSPREIIIRVNNCDNLKCFYCSGTRINNQRTFDDFFYRLEPRISRYISQAERITFRSCGIFFQSIKIKHMVSWNVNLIDAGFPEVNKTYYSNGLDLEPDVCRFLTKPPIYDRKKGKVENIVNILLCASNDDLYKTLIGNDDFAKILSQIHYFLKLRENGCNPLLYFTFVVTSLNIEDLPSFVKLASGLGVNKVICEYRYKPEVGSTLSLDQDATGKIFDTAEKAAKELNIEIELPSKIGQKKDICRKPWSQMTISPAGYVLSCDTLGDCGENLLEKDLMDVWNGSYYLGLRKDLIEKNGQCSKGCHQISPVFAKDSRSGSISISQFGQASEIDIQQKTDDPLVRFSWNMLYDCNYRCSYCFFDGKWQDYRKRNIYLSPEEWSEHWKAVHDKYGPPYINITGGEPFIYPNFIEIIKRLSQICYHINISSNSSGDLKTFIQQINPDKVSLSLSFHPQFDNLEDFIERVIFIRNHKFNGCLNFLAYPPFLKDIGSYKDKINSIGERLKVIPFFGEYQGKVYPDAYTREEKKLIGIDEAWLQKVRKKGSLCPAGQRTALIFPDGKVARCGQVGENMLLGSFLERNFKLLDAPLPCEAEYCPCDEGEAAPKDEQDTNIREISESKPKMNSVLQPEKEERELYFTWDIHYKCNFRCPYCWFYKKWPQEGRRNVYLSPEEWMVHWRRVYDKYGPIRIEITGGEPSIYPNFIKLIKLLSSVHTIKITTNMSGDIETFVKEIDPKRVNLDLNFHPLFSEIGNFIKKTLLLKEAGFKAGVCYLAYPPQMGMISIFKRHFEENGINFALAAFWGEFEGKRYPAGYTQGEIELIRPLLGDIDRIVYHLKGESPKGKLCYAGYKYAIIQADGNVVRCGQLADKFIGNIFEEGFRLFDAARSCEAEACPCNEYINVVE